MSTKPLKPIIGRISHKHDTEAHWQKAENFTPLKGELIVYDTHDADNTRVADRPRLKVGDGITNVNDLPFVVDNNIKDSDNNGIEQKTDPGYSYVETGNALVNEDALNGVPNDRGDAMPVDDATKKPLLGARGAFASAFGGNSLALGKRAHAEGSSTVAFGSYSHAEGNGTYSKGTNSHAEGSQTTAYLEGSHSEGVATKAAGKASHAEGQDTVADGVGSHAEGYGTVTSNDFAHAEGENARAEGQASHAEGSSLALGTYSHAEGLASASGTGAHAEGKATATGEASHAEGTSTRAAGDSAHAEGRGTVADGDVSHAEGHNAVAAAVGSHAEGLATVANGQYQHVQGKFNIADTTSAFIIGNGDGPEEQNRKNAMTVDWEGNAWFKGAAYAGGNNLSEGNKLATEDFVDDYVQRQKGTADGIAALDSTGKIISSQLPSYVDDVVEVHVTSFSPLQLYKVTGAQTGRTVRSHNIFSIVNSKNIISNFDPSIGEDLEELHIAHGSSIDLRFAATGDNRVPIPDVTGYYTISAEFQDDKSYIEVYDQLGSVVRATISSSQPSATFYSSSAAAGGVQLQFKNSLSNTLIIKKLQVSIGEEVLDYQKYEKGYVYINPVTGEYVTADLVTPECGKIYIDILNGANKTFRWSGSALVEISKSLALGTTSASAYRGDYGNKAYQHSLKTSGNPHKVTKLDVGLGNVTNDAQVKRSEMGVANGVATLDDGGRIPSAQLPSYVDDVLEGIIVDNTFRVPDPTGPNVGRNVLDLQDLHIDGMNIDTQRGSIYGHAVQELTISGSYCGRPSYYDSHYNRVLISFRVAYDDISQYSLTVTNGYNGKTLETKVYNDFLYVVLEEDLDHLYYYDIHIAKSTGFFAIDSFQAVLFDEQQDNINYLLDNFESVTIYSLPLTPESSKIYLDTSNGLAYRWSGTRYVVISQSLALGETKATAYAGDKGAQNASDIITLQNQVKDLTDKLQQLTAFVNALEIVATDDGTGVITFSLQSLPSAEEGEF